MFKKTILTILIMLFAVSAVSAENTIQTFDDIQSEITTAQSGDTVTLSGDYHGGNEIYIEKDITLQRTNSSILDADKKLAIVYASGNTNFNDITFKNAKKNTEFTGTVMIDENATFRNCIFENNWGRKGSAVNCIGSLTLINCTFINNHAENGGAVFYMHPDSTGKLTIINSTFTQNTAGENASAVFSIMGEDTTDTTES